MALRRFDMPVLFGPSLLPDVSPVTGTTVAAISFETTKAAAAALLPRFFDLTEIPVVSLTWIDYPRVEYLGGRGYRELVVAVSSVFRDESGDMRAGFSPVMWVDQVGALISGREYMGFAKLFGNFSFDRNEDHGLYRCYEYDALLVEGEAYALTQVSHEGLDKINRSAKEVNAFGWKYIPSDGDKPDADYPIVNVTRWNYIRAWSGQGKLRFGNLTAQAAPSSSRIIDTLSRLPIREYRRSFVAEGDVIIDRTATRRLHKSSMVLETSRR
jgi:acetoacetate decarboxylase